MGFPNTIHSSESELFNSYTSESTPVGSKMVLADGRVFRFAENAAGSVLVVGSLNQGALIHATDWLTEAIDTLAAGVTILTGVGESGTEPGENFLKYGYIYTDNAVTLPLMQIKSNTGDTTTFTVVLFNATPTAIAQGNTVSYFGNPWRDVFIHDSPATAVYTGVCKIGLAINAFGWLQTAGPASVLYSSTTTAIAAINDPVCGAPGVAGSVQGLAAGTTETNPIVGFALGPIEGDTEQTAIFLDLE